MTIEVTVKSKTNETILLSKDGTDISVPVSFLPSTAQVGDSVWLTIDVSPPTASNPKDIINELLASDQYEEAV